MLIRRLAFTLAAIAATATTTQAGAPGIVDVAIDEARLIRLDADAAEVIVGNPAIADVTAQSARILVVTGKSFGATNLIALDAKGREILAARLGVGEGSRRLVRLYKGTHRQSLHCAPDCQRTLTIGDDKAQFEQLAETVTKRFGVVHSATGGGQER
jgi:Flp pilus assembly secretin CpaC